ncbi:uncharacterized protein ARMOST_14059 [Armillaria ostoyae]|uniref:Uncharacterized protein n=1 Tax=Armillaria ostoyae TaxID=47428 RepID=A0A284RPK3_ARMOS|nr:uncharacterized protein ARMOST_14059 [Armillaria ostoyae]
MSTSNHSSPLGRRRLFMMHLTLTLPSPSPPSIFAVARCGTVVVTDAPGYMECSFSPLQRSIDVPQHCTLSARPSRASYCGATTYRRLGSKGDRWFGDFKSEEGVGDVTGAGESFKSAMLMSGSGSNGGFQERRVHSRTWGSALSRARRFGLEGIPLRLRFDLRVVHSRGAIPESILTALMPQQIAACTLFFSVESQRQARDFCWNISTRATPVRCTSGGRLPPFVRTSIPSGWRSYCQNGVEMRLDLGVSGTMVATNDVRTRQFFVALLLLPPASRTSPLALRPVCGPCTVLDAE